MALSSGSVEPSGRALVGWRRSRGWSVSLGLSTVRSHIGGLYCFPSQPYSGVASCEEAKVLMSVAERAQERTLHRQPPDTEFNVQQSAASRVMIEEYLKRTKTEIWVEHDFVANAKLKKSPAYYE